MATAPPAGAPGPRVTTKISGQDPEAVEGEAPHVQVLSAPSAEPRSVVWWLVAIIALGAFFLGLAAGYALASGAT